MTSSVLMPFFAISVDIELLSLVFDLDRSKGFSWDTKADEEINAVVNGKSLLSY